MNQNVMNIASGFTKSSLLLTCKQTSQPPRQHRVVCAAIANQPQSLCCNARVLNIPVLRRCMSCYTATTGTAA